MSLLTNLNRKPYFNDYDPNSGYHDVLFKGGVPLQSRELNGLQSAIYHQIEELGGSFFTNGDQIENGGYNYQSPIDYVRLSSFTQGAKIEDFVGSIVRGVVSGAVAEVVYATPQTVEDDATLYVNYVSAGVDAEQKVFVEGETLESDTENNYTASVGLTNTSKPITSPAIGYGSLFTAEPGAFWVNGRIVRTDRQTIPVDKYSTKGCGQVGYIVDEDIITCNEDESLKDNAQGHSNFAAPGADRMRITLHLSIRASTEVIPNFIGLVNIQQGMLIGNPVKNIGMTWLNDLLATRTFEESGSYTVTEFPIEALYYQNTEELDGVYEADPERFGVDTPYPPCPPSHPGEGPLYCGQEGLTPGDPGYLKPLSYKEADDKYILKVSPGIAYVQGYRVGFSNPYYICGHKPRSRTLKPDVYTQMNPGAFVKVINTYGNPDFRNIRDDVPTDAFDSMIYYRNFTDGYVSDSYDISDTQGGTVNQARPLNVGNKPWTTYHIITDKELGSINFSKDGRTTVKIHTTEGIKEGILVYPNPSISRTTEENVLLSTDPAQDLINTEFGDRLLLDSAPVSLSVKGKNSLVVAFEGEVPDVIRGDGIDVRGYESYDVLPKALISKKIEPIKAGVMHPKYFYGDSLIDENNDGFFGANSTYNLGILNTIDFIELAVVDDIETATEDWKLGFFVIGETSGALGKLEDVRQNVLMVSNVYGSFQEGESVYQILKAKQNEEIKDLLSTEELENINTESLDRLLLDYKDSGSLEVKYGRLIRNGEVLALNFNSYPGGLLDGSSPGGGGDSILADQIFIDLFNLIINRESDVYTSDVILTNPSSDSVLRLPPESGLSTQEDANHWFYYSILALQQGVEANNVFVEDTDPVNLDVDGPHIGDIWINKQNYVMYIRTVEETVDDAGNPDEVIEMWVGITPGNLPDNISPAVISLAEEFYASVVRNNLARATTSDRSEYDLSNDDRIIVYALGSKLELFKNTDYTHNSKLNKLVLTEDGRQKIYKYSFFNPSNVENKPRINYELLSMRGDSAGSRGYATTSPAKLVNDIKKSKAFWSDLAENNDDFTAQFSADAGIVSATGSDAYNVANGAVFSGSALNNYVTCDDFTGDASEDLIAGDLVAIADQYGNFEYKIVAFATKPYGYGRKKTKCTIYFTTTLEYMVRSVTVQRLRLKKFGDVAENLIFQIPVGTISSLESNHDVTGIDYKVFREYVTTVVGNTSSANTSISFTTLESNATFISDPYKCVVTVAKSEDTSDIPSASYRGRSLALDPVVPIVISDSGRDITINLNSKLPPNTIVKAILPVQKTNGRAKRKILVRDKEITIPNLLGKTATLFEQKIIPLRELDTDTGELIGYKDIFKLHSVTYVDDEGNVIDATDNYVLDNGQRTTYYDMGRLIIKDGRPYATKDLIIKFDYFEHVSGAGEDFFSVDSYTHEQGIPYEEIPVFHPTAGPSYNQTSGENPNYYLKLRDCVDFRPSVNTIRTTPMLDPVNGITSTPDGTLDSMYDFGDYSIGEYVFDYRDRFVGGNAFVPSIPIPYTQFKADVEHYLPKIDSLFVDKTGTMILAEGEPSENPVPPADIATGIRLYDIHMPAYTFDMEDVTIRKFNYRRYTMKDIMDIDRRVDRVERLVGLSILEQSAMNTNVRDAVTGLDRFKNGIVVDPFQDHSKGDVGSQQYRVSIDAKETHMRSSFVMDQIDLEEASETKLQRDELGYKQNSNIVTVDYSTVDYIGQDFATTSIPVQITTSSVFEGKISLYPPVDTFRDNHKLPRLMVENSEVFSADLQLTDEQVIAGMGTVWGEWETLAGLAPNRTNDNGIERTNKRLDNIIPGDKQYNAGHVYITPSSISMQNARNYVNHGSNVNTVSVQNTSYGDRIVDVQLSHTMRSIPVYFKAERLKPNTRYYAFFDDINVSDWVCVDNIDTNYPDTLSRYGSEPNDDPKGFGQPIISDSDGNITGVFIIPNGRSPVAGSMFTGKMEDVEYNTSGSTRSFTTGQRSFKLTSSPTDLANLTDIQGYAKADFVSRSVLADKSENIVSTRISEYTTNTTLQENVRLSHQSLKGTDYNPDFVPSPVNTPTDPIAQTFEVDRNYPDGVFVTELDLFFRQKDLIQGVESYIVSTEAGLPTNKIVPHSRVVVPSSTVLRVTCKLIDVLKSTAIENGTIVKGMTSGATGVVKSNVNFMAEVTNPNQNVNNTVYNLVISNHLGDFIPGEEIVPQTNPANANQFFIAEDEVTVTRVDIKMLGRDYDDTTYIEFEAPQLPGGKPATADVKVSSDGKVYDIVLTSSGSGYTHKPGIEIKSPRGVNAVAEARIVDGRKGVVMGVATSDDATAPTKFKFSAPVYLLGNSTYAIVVKAPTTDQYVLWASKIGEKQIGTSKKVVRQPNTGKLIVSQNQGLWTEDQSTDLTFNLRRANFEVNKVANVKLHNYPISSKIIQADPIQTGHDPLINPPDSISGVSQDYPDIDKYGFNHSIVKVYHYNHGFVSGDLVTLSGVEGNPGGVPNERLNNLHEIIDVSLEDFTIDVGLTDEERTKVVTAKGGGSKVYCSYNRPYETVNMTAGAMTFPTSTLITMNRPTEHAGLPSVPVVVDTDTEYSVTMEGYNQKNSYKLEVPDDIPLMDSYYYSGAKQVAHPLNEALYSDDLHLRRQKSLETNVMLSTSDSRVSPVIDLDRTNMQVVHNMVDYPSKYYSTTGTPTVVLTFKNSIQGFKEKTLDFITRRGKSISLPITDINNISKKITVTGNQALEIMNYASFAKETLQDNKVKVTVKPATGYFDESQNNGSAYSKWISKLFVFDTECDGIEVRISSIIYKDTNVRVYYKVRNSGVDSDFSQINWTAFNPYGVRPNETQKRLFREGEDNFAAGKVNTNDYEVTPGLPDNANTIKVRSSVNVDPRKIIADEWQTLIYSVQDLFKFDAIAIKVVLESNNPALTPLVDDIAVICTE